MTQSIARNHQFSFQCQELESKLLEYIPRGGTGYWQCQFERFLGQEQPLYWHIALCEGKICYSGGRTWTIQTFLRILSRYVKEMRNDQIKSSLGSLQKQLGEQSILPNQMMTKLSQLGLITQEQIIQALHLKILNDLDTYLLLGAGSAKFISYPELAGQFLFSGFDVNTLLEEVKQRQQMWYQLKQQVPSMNLQPIIDESALAKSPFPLMQKQQIQGLVKQGRTLNNIAELMARDSLEVAQMFAQLIKAGLVTLEPTVESRSSTIMIIDDSPLVLAQFQHWSKALGYPVVICQNAETAINRILQIKPATIFIDINMPGISGFELVKQIRQLPQIATVPLVILTGEQKLSNKWRAQWSACEFLNKPLTVKEVGNFQSQLQELLQRLIPHVTPSNSTES